MHPENKLIDGYDFESFVIEFPDLNPFLQKNKYDRYTLDFSKKECVATFNKALLQKYYNIAHWQVPTENLCPTVPGRADYLHYIKDIIGNGKKKILDIGTGATVIYPLLGNRLFDWQFVASEVDKKSVEHAQSILDKNNFPKSEIELRLQPNREKIFENIIKENEVFDTCICNPPFFESEEQAHNWNQKKWKSDSPTNVGTNSELICEGGEKAFITNMIIESKKFRKNVKLFTCLVSKKSTIPFIEKACAANTISSLRFIEMKTGRKISRIAVWNF